MVDLVVKVAPQEQVTWRSLYSGWIPASWCVLSSLLAGGCDRPLENAGLSLNFPAVANVLSGWRRASAAAAGRTPGSSRIRAHSVSASAVSQNTVPHARSACTFSSRNTAPPPALSTMPACAATAWITSASRSRNAASPDSAKMSAIDRPARCATRASVSTKSRPQPGGQLLTDRRFARTAVTDEDNVLHARLTAASGALRGRREGHGGVRLAASLAMPPSRALRAYRSATLLPSAFSFLNRLQHDFAHDGNIDSRCRTRSGIAPRPAAQTSRCRRS